MAACDSAFSLIPFVGQDYFEAVKNAVLAQDDERANALLIKGVENGLPTRQYYDSTVQAFMLSERAMPFLNTWSYMESRYKERIDTVLVNELLEIGTGLKMIEDEHGGLSSESDSTAFDRFLSLVALRGFPTLLSAGHFAFRPQWLFAQTLSDYPEDPRWQRVLPYIQRAIIAGHLPPDYLCMFQDLDDLAHGKPLTYGTMLWSFDQEDVIVLARHDAVDNARAAVGLGPIDHAIALAGLRPEQVTFSEDKNLTPR